MNTYQALQTLHVNKESTQTEIKVAYRKLALELHPDKNKNKKESDEFKKITEAYHILKDYKYQEKPANNFKTTRPKESDGPQQDWGKYTQEFEKDTDFWKDYEKNFWQEYNARVNANGKNGEYQKAQEPDKQPNLFVDVDKSLCIGCCSCEILAPNVFEIDKHTQSNPKSSVINQKGAGINKIMNAAQTCPTKAIRVENSDTNEKLFPF